METAKQMSLSEQPEIIELMQVLKAYGMAKEQQEVEHLVGYLEGMENQFGQVIEELKEVRAQLEQMQDKGVKTSVLGIVEKAENKIEQIGRQLSTVKRKLIYSAKNAVAEYKEKGITVLSKAVKAMKIHTALSCLKEGFNRCSAGLDKDAADISVIRDELHSAKGHIKNIGRTLTGKHNRQEQTQTPDSGILFKVQNLLLSCSEKFSSMEKMAENVMKRVEGLEKHDVKKVSVKNELKKIKNRNTGDAPVQPIKKEPTR